MKKNVRLILFTLLIMSIIVGCDKKNTTTTTPIGLVQCQLKMIGNPNGNTSTAYEYNTAGKLISIKNYSGNSLNVSATLDEFSIVSNYTSSSGFPMVSTFTFEGGSIFADQLPSKESVAQQEGTITHTNVFNYYFYYDNKDRLVKVSEETQNVKGDWEYDLFISYDDHDNVTSLKYAWTTGPNTVTTIPATGYDDKPNPYSGLRTWKYLMGWDASDPTGLFAQLSKNNPLGFIDGDWTRKITYGYSENGYPIIRNNIQTVKGSADTAKWAETFNYQCK
jgi:YD repeat-containing protein